MPGTPSPAPAPDSLAPPARPRSRPRLRLLVGIALLGTVALACNEGGPESDILADVPLYEEQADGTRTELDGTDELAEVLDIELDLPEALPEGLTIVEGVVLPPGRVLELPLRGEGGEEARMRINRDTANPTSGEPVMDIGGVRVFQGASEETDETVYHWASCRQNYALQTADEWATPPIEEIIGTFVNSCEQPFSPPAS